MPFEAWLGSLLSTVTTPEAVTIQGVSIDSRTLKEGNLFVPIVRIADGHHYVKQIHPNLSFTINRYHDEFSVSLLGRHNVLNVVAAIAVADRFHINQRDIQSGLTHLEVTGMRMERISTPKGFLIINDAWNASPVSMKAAIETISNLEGFNKKVLVLGDMLELGDNEIEFHKEIAESIDRSKIHSVFTIGNLGRIIADTLHDSKIEGIVKHFTSKEELVSECENILDKNDVLLVKGSRGLKLEEICDLLNK